MASIFCMNVSCGATSSIEWRKGWDLRSGGFANLCDKCGSAYEQLVFCDVFHLKESGWRECSSCGKRLHCGCIASKSLLQLLDNGGVECISCMKSTELSSIPGDEKPNGYGTSTIDNAGEPQAAYVDSLQLGKNMEASGLNNMIESQKDNTNRSHGQIKTEQVMPAVGFSNLNLGSAGSSEMDKHDNNKEIMGCKDMYESLAQTSLNITLGSPSRTPNFALPLPGAVVEGREQSKTTSSFQQGQRSRHVLPKSLKTGFGMGPETNKDMLPQIRVARPPAEGRGRNQLLPRYWPRITDQELQQISGDLNSTIVPLFEKVLSASDAGRIGRLVLPKACAEAYFPPISQPEGRPLRIQDAKGKEWVFQFRFWPNNNSRMYVLEGVTPCIQSMQLQAGDTVTFSRIDPEGKLVMGFRKASNSITVQDTQISAIANGALANETFFSGVIENLPIISGYSGLLQSLKGSTDPHLNALSEHLSSADGDIGWCHAEKHGGRKNEGLTPQPMLEKRRNRNIGSKSKRLLIDTEDALELKLTWEEAQNLLRPPPTVKPKIVLIEDHEFEEYEEPPVFGKRTIFTAHPSGRQEQWAQCDSCSKWRRLPVDFLLPPKWTCADNAWDARRSSCLAPDEMSPKDLETFLRLSMDFKKRKIDASHKPVRECEPSGLDALATAAVLGEKGDELGTTSIATTTRHPRHRPGCTCIVCIQPPSGKGPKHKPTCTCNVCMTVKRRFKTLMMRKKKRQSEREAEIAQKKHHVWVPKDEADVDSTSRSMALPPDSSDDNARQGNELESGGQSKVLAEKTTETSKGQIDLNCHPDREEEMQAGLSRVSMMDLLQVASLPLEMYLKQNGLTSLICEQQASSSSHVLPQATGESEGRLPNEDRIASVVHELEDVVDDGYCEPEQAHNDPV